MPVKKKEESDEEEEEKEELPAALKNSELKKIRSVNDDTLIKLDTIGVHTFEALSVLTIEEAVKEAEITEDRFFKIHTEARSIVGRTVEFAPLDPSKKKEYIPSGSKAVDELLDGGYQVGEITELCAQYAVGKCVKFDTLVVDTETGELITVEEAYHKKQVNLLSINDKLKVQVVTPSEFIDDGKRICYRVTMRSGKTVEVTLSHPFLTVNGWLPLHKLRPNDRVAVPRIIPVFGKEDMPEYRIKLLAHLIAEGHVSNQIAFTNSEQVMLEDFKASALEFPNVHVTSYQSHGPTTTTLLVYKNDDVEKNSIRDYLREVGLFNTKSATKFIPLCIFRLPKKSLSLFLRTIFSGDGSVDKQHIEYYSTSERLVRQISHLLLRYGILCTIRHRIQKVNDEPYNVWSIVVTDYDSILRFSEDIGFIGMKSKKLQGCVTRRGNLKRGHNVDTIPYGIFSIIQKAKKRVKWKHIDKRWGSYWNIRVGHSPSREVVMSLSKELNSGELRGLAESDVFWDEITNIESIGSYQVYDLVVPETHNFIANDVFIHNTNSCMTAAVMCYGTFKAPTMYLHTELAQPFSHDRLIQIAKARKIDYPTVTEKDGRVLPGPQFTYCDVLTTEDQDWAVRNCDTFMKKTKAKLFVIDSMMSLYRKEFQGREFLPIRQGHINRLLNRLTKISNIFGAAVIVTNQLVADPGVGANVYKPAGGPIMQYGVGKVLQLKATGYSDKSINDKGEREVIITKSVNHPVESRSCKITEKGLDDV